MVTYAAADIQSGISDYKALVSWCDPLQPADPPPPLPKKIPFFWQKKLKWDFLGMCARVFGVLGGKWEPEAQGVPECSLKNEVLLFQLVETAVTYHVTTEAHFCFKIGSFIPFFPLLFVLLSCTVDLNFAFHVIQPWSRPKRAGLLFYRDL